MRSRRARAPVCIRRSEDARTRAEGHRDDRERAERSAAAGIRAAPGRQRQHRIRRVLESNSNETARSLALKHSPEVCHLFKLGTLWGYASLVRPSLPGERAIFAAEIRHHAKSATLDGSLWQPMTESTKASATKEEIFRADAAVTEGLTLYLGGQR